MSKAWSGAQASRRPEARTDFPPSSSALSTAAATLALGRLLAASLARTALVGARSNVAARSDVAARRRRHVRLDRNGRLGRRCHAHARSVGKRVGERTRIRERVFDEEIGAAEL